MTTYKKLYITYSNPNNIKDFIIVDYNLRNTPIANKWVERVLTAQQLGYTIDEPSRFYGFGDIKEQINFALTSINQTIINLNKWISIDLTVNSVSDQDVLNRLHHIFEIEHGLLNQKDFNVEFKQNLCNLNLLVHRCESIARGAQPRHVVTYFGLPKTVTLTNDDYQFFEHNVNFGTVYINYAEIGKTLYDLMMDNDTYIKSDAFQPFYHYSADFNIKFWSESNRHLKSNLYNYYIKNKNFFENLGYTWETLSKTIGNIPVADLQYTGNILQGLNGRQCVTAVHFS